MTLAALMLGGSTASADRDSADCRETDESRASPL
jgi:hypothetical protein